jgi:hypothetical protein
MLALGLIVSLLAVDVVTGARLELNAVFGYSPTVAGRFSGYGNLAFAQLAVAAIAVAALAVHMVDGRRGITIALAVLGVVLVLDGAPMWGSDVGGVLTAVPAFAVVGWGLTQRRVRPRLVVGLLAAAVVAVGGFAAIDLARPASERSHLGRLVESVQHDGFGALTRVVARKADANLSVLTRSVWTLLVPVVLGFVAWLVYRAPGRLAVIHRRMVELRPALAGVLIAGVLGFALNDSGIAVPGLMLGVLNPVLVYLAARWT